MKLNNEERMMLKILAVNELQFYENKEDLTKEDKEYMELLNNIINKLKSKKEND